MNACICTRIPEDLREIRDYRVRGAVALAGAGTVTEHPAEGEERFHVVLIDYGAKRNIIRCLCRRGCRVTAVPHDTPAEAILARRPDGIMLSNGPGDPQENV